MSTKISEQIKSQFGVEVEVVDVVGYCKVNGYRRIIQGDDFSVKVEYNILVNKQSGRTRVRIKEISVNDYFNSVLDKKGFDEIIKDFHTLERRRKGKTKGRNPNTWFENDFNTRLIQLLQTTDNDNLNQGILLGILQDMNDKIISLKAEIREMAENAVLKPETDDIITVEEAMVFLGFKKSTIYTKVNRGEIPHMKKGKRLYFSVTELKKYLREGKRLTNDEINEMAQKYLNNE